jgi:hypothetical protein
MLAHIFVGGVFPKDLALGEKMRKKRGLKTHQIHFILSLWVARWFGVIVLRSVDLGGRSCALRSMVHIPYRTPPPFPL